MINTIILKHEIRKLFKLSLKYPQFNLGFNCILRLRHLNEQLLNISQESSVPYVVRLTRYLAETTPIVSCFLELLFNRFSKKSFSTVQASYLYY
jgi:hypothetical protein